MDTEIEQKAKQCNQCQINQRKSPIAPLHPWEWPGKPWSRIHLDYAGLFQGRMFLVIFDSLEVYVTHSASSAVTIENFKQLWVCPKQLLQTMAHVLLAKNFKHS